VATLHALTPPINTQPDHHVSKFSVCVYCGSRPGALPAYSEAARRIGHEIGQRGWQLVYGGGRAGLMGEVADSALSAGASVIGVIPQSLMGKELGHTGLTELHVVDTMHQRKMMMAERSDAFLALPGGIGTFEELFEIWSWRQLGYHDKPLGLLNVAGYYDALLAFLKQSKIDGFMSAAQTELLLVDTEPARILDTLATAAKLATGPDDYSRI
jgi:uncharacterized protein (TIGR00730 family)